MPLPEPNKKYTFADYLIFPENERWEIFEGMPILQAAPSWQHQAISGELLTQFNIFLSGNPCQVFAAPFDLRLPESEKENDAEVTNVLQPDITVVCDKSKLKGSGYFGKPSLIIEITSPSTSRIDKMVKFNIYEKAGVSEYWIVEPEGRFVSVFTLQADGRYGRPEIYSEDDMVKVSIFPSLTVDLKKVFKDIEGLL